jgi:phytoene dehydrogenase-like protein
VPTSFYDVVVLGTYLEPLLCAALLAREGLRVLVLGQGAPAPSYEIGDITVDPYIFQPLGVQSPAVRSALDLLALRQDVRQQMTDDTALQLLLPNHRLEVDPDPNAWLTEIERELPAIRQQASDITRTLSEVGAELDALTRRNLAWPPESFLERQQFSFAASAQR